MMHRRTIKGSIWLYRQLLILYPEEFRRAYAQEMTQVFATQCRRTTNTGALLWLWLTALGDLFTNAIEEIFMTAERKGQSTLVIALVFGLAAGLLGGVSELTNASIVGDFGELLMGYIAICGFIALAAGAGLVAARISKRAITGLWVGLLVGVIAALIANTTRVGVSIAFYDFVRYDLQIPDWVHRDSSTFVNYLIKDRIGGFIYMPPFFGAIGAVCGIIGGLLSKARDMRGVL